MLEAMGPTLPGQCSLSALDPRACDPSLELDGDTCGDLNAGTYQRDLHDPRRLSAQDTDGDGSG